MSSLIDDFDLAEMRRCIDETVRPDICVIYRDTVSASRFSRGGSTVPQAIGTANCYVEIWPYRPFEGNTGGAIVGVTNWAVSLPYDTDIQKADRILYKGRAFHVVEDGGEGSWQGSLRMLCHEINEGSQ